MIIKDQCHYEKENNAYLPKYDNSDNEDQCHYEIKTDVSIDNNSDIEDRCDYDIKTDVSFSTDDNSDIWEMKHTCQLCGYQTSQKNNLKLQFMRERSISVTNVSIRQLGKVTLLGIKRHCMRE